MCVCYGWVDDSHSTCSFFFYRQQSSYHAQFYCRTGFCYSDVTWGLVHWVIININIIIIALYNILCGSGLSIWLLNNWSINVVSFLVYYLFVCMFVCLSVCLFCFLLLLLLSLLLFMLLFDWKIDLLVGEWVRGVR